MRTREGIHTEAIGLVIAIPTHSFIHSFSKCSLSPSPVPSMVQVLQASLGIDPVSAFASQDPSLESIFP